MYGLSKDLDLNFLSGREIEQIAIGSHEIIFAFDEDVSVTVYSEFRFFDGQDEYIWTPEPAGPQIAARTLSLLGAVIQNFKGRQDGTLLLAFSNGQRLIILDSSKEHESYDIARPGSTIVV